MKVGRNDPCHCGSGQKYKKCCLAKDDAARSAELASAAAKAAEAAAAAEAEEGKGDKGDDRAPGARSKGGAAPAVQPKTSAPGPSPAFRRKAV